MRRERAYSPMPFNRYDVIKNNLVDGETATIHRINEHQPEEFYARPIGPQQNNNPWLRNIGLVGLGAGLGALGYRYHKPMMKLGKKAINYAMDKFHHLFTPTNETIPQIENRQAF